MTLHVVPERVRFVELRRRLLEAFPDLPPRRRRSGPPRSRAVGEGLVLQRVSNLGGFSTQRATVCHSNLCINPGPRPAGRLSGAVKCT